MWITLINTLFHDYEEQAELYQAWILRLKQERWWLITDILIREEGGILYIHQQHPEKLFPRYRATVWNDKKLTRQVETRKKQSFQYFIDENGENQLFPWEKARERRIWNKGRNVYAENDYRWETFSVQEEAFEDPKPLLNKTEAETLLYLSQQLFSILKK